MQDRTSILLVEDHFDTRKMMALLLKRSGFIVIEAATVAEGVAMTDGQTVALLDFNLPDGLGTEVQSHIRGKGYRTSVAFLTASGHPELLVFIDGSKAAYFKKPIDYSTLLKWINKQADSIGDA